jgi:hypothetical protein
LSCTSSFLSTATINGFLVLSKGSCASIEMMTHFLYFTTDMESVFQTLKLPCDSRTHSPSSW